MPGQRKRRQQRKREAERAAARFALEAGRWDVLFETQDESEFREQVRRLRESDPQIDWSAVRIDNFCGRLTSPNTHRLSLFVPHPVSPPAQDPPEC